MILQNNYPLRTRHTFGIDSVAKQYVECISDDDIRQLIHQHIFDAPFFILGGGSNVVFGNQYDGTIIHPVMMGINIISKSDNKVIVECGAGVEWDAFVEYCVNQGFYGIENLSYIPGHVGASPVQNIGAYGVEACDCIDYVCALDLKTGKELILTGSECQFGYRNSIFKNELKNRVIITRVAFQLSLIPNFKLDYGHIQDALSKRGEVTLRTIRETIIEIRRSKLPDPTELGNAGSFFKNPVISASRANELLRLYPQMPHYRLENNEVKIPAGWLIEMAGWKGRHLGHAAVHDKQALVIVNLGKATADDIANIALAVEKDVRLKFDICLDKEVNFVF